METITEQNHYRDMLVLLHHHHKANHIEDQSHKTATLQFHLPSHQIAWTQLQTVALFHTAPNTKVVRSAWTHNPTHKIVPSLSQQEQFHVVQMIDLTHLPEQHHLIEPIQQLEFLPHEDRKKVVQWRFPDVWDLRHH